jgi:DNA-binding beta-propeller fold protein YncE
LRFILGPHAELADPHGIYVDSEGNEIFVTNHGNLRETKTEEDIESRANSREEAALPLAPSTGKFVPPSVTVYPRMSQGDVPPLRIIQGSRTQLNLPLGITRDSVSGQIVVANSGGDSVLFFDAKASGNVAPVRVLKGRATNVQAPTGVLIDTPHNELWVTSWENHMTNVFPRMAEGNTAPLRYIRSAAKDAPPATFGTPGAVAWDPKRKEILIPN